MLATDFSFVSDTAIRDLVCAQDNVIRTYDVLFDALDDETVGRHVNLPGVKVDIVAKRLALDDKQLALAARMAAAKDIAQAQANTQGQTQPRPNKRPLDNTSTTPTTTQATTTQQHQVPQQQATPPIVPPVSLPTRRMPISAYRARHAPPPRTAAPVRQAPPQTSTQVPAAHRRQGVFAPPARFGTSSTRTQSSRTKPVSISSGSEFEADSDLTDTEDELFSSAPSSMMSDSSLHSVDDIIEDAQAEEDDDMHKIARYLSGDNCYWANSRETVIDWVRFSEKNPKRSNAEWRKFYRNDRRRKTIDALVERYKHKRAKRANRRD